VADAIDRVLAPKGVAVVIEAAHECMTTRGIRKHESMTVTSRMTGEFRDNPSTRREFLAMIGMG
ncbi:MAG: GTP cyclohydrolase I, partial [Planctomycetota bacterium]